MHKDLYSQLMTVKFIVMNLKKPKKNLAKNPKISALKKRINLWSGVLDPGSDSISTDLLSFKFQKYL